MRATGIVRRIDDLGRVVIPKEIRRTMRIREGDPLEIYTDREGEVIFKKYSPIGELVDFATQYAESLYKTCNFPVVICDRDTIVACAGISKKENLDRRISPEMDYAIEQRNLYYEKPQTPEKERIYISADNKNYRASSLMPIFVEGDVIGCVAAVLPSDKEITAPSGASDTEIKLIQTAANFLGRQLEP